MRSAVVRRLARLCMGIVAVMPLFAASFETHVGPASHGETPASAWLSPGALHPDQPHHIETSKLVHTGACPACILQVQSACDGVAHSPAIAAPDVTADLPAAGMTAPRTQSRLPAFSRGPPAA